MSEIALTPTGAAALPPFPLPFTASLSNSRFMDRWRLAVPVYGVLFGKCHGPVVGLVPQGLDYARICTDHWMACTGWLMDEVFGGLQSRLVCDLGDFGALLDAAEDAAESHYFGFPPYPRRNSLLARRTRMVRAWAADLYAAAVECRGIAWGAAWETFYHTATRGPELLKPSASAIRESYATTDHMELIALTLDRARLKLSEDYDAAPEFDPGAADPRPQFARVLLFHRRWLNKQHVAERVSRSPLNPELLRYLRAVALNGASREQPAMIEGAKPPAVESASEPAPETEPTTPGKRPSKDMMDDLTTVIRNQRMPLMQREILSILSKKKPGGTPHALAWMVKHGVLVNIPGRGYWPAGEPVPE